MTVASSKAQGEATVALIMASLPGTQRDLSSKTGITPSTIGKWLGRLMDDGTVYVAEYVDHPQGPKMRMYAVRDKGQENARPPKSAGHFYSKLEREGRLEQQALCKSMEQWLPKSNAFRHPMDIAFFGNP